MKRTRKGKRKGHTGISNERTRKRTRKKTTMADSNRKTLQKMPGNLSDFVRIMFKIGSKIFQK